MSSVSSGRWSVESGRAEAEEEAEARVARLASEALASTTTTETATSDPADALARLLAALRKRRAQARR